MSSKNFVAFGDISLPNRIPAAGTPLFAQRYFSCLDSSSTASWIPSWLLQLSGRLYMHRIHAHDHPWRIPVNQALLPSSSRQTSPCLRPSGPYLSSKYHRLDNVAPSRTGRCLSSSFFVPSTTRANLLTSVYHSSIRVKPLTEECQKEYFGYVGLLTLDRAF